MGVEHPTRTDTKAEDADRHKPSDKPPGPPPDNPGAPGQPSRLKSLARAREPAPRENGPQQVAVKDRGTQPTDARDDKLASTQVDSGEEKDGPSEPETQDRKWEAAEPLAEESSSETDDESRQDERGQKVRPENAEAKQAEAGAGGDDSQRGRDDKTAAAEIEGFGEKAETRDEPATSERKYTMPADNPGSPNQPSRLESLARAREPVQESSPHKTQAPDTGSPPPAEPAIEPASPSGNDGPKTERPQEQTSTPQQDQQPGTDEPASSLASGAEDAHDIAEGVAQEPPSRLESLPGNDVGAGPSEPDSLPTADASDASDAWDGAADDLERGTPTDSLPADKGGIAAYDEDALERGVSDRLKKWAARLDGKDAPRELEGMVHQPDLPAPKGEPGYGADRYGRPLDRADGTRTPLFNGMPKREQVEQGELGDCGIIATLGAIAAHQPEALRACVSETDDGNYQVRLHEAGYSVARQRYEPTGASITLTVTPDLPVKDEAPDHPVFAPVLGNAAWAPVLEKAIAGSDRTWSAERWGKMKRLREAQGKSGDLPKGYVRLNEGSSPGERAELLTQLTGLPARTVQFPSSYDNQGRSADRQLHDEIAQQLSDGKPVLVGIRDKRKGESKLPKGLRANHAYEVTKIDGQGKLHLRNPWGDRHPEPMTVQEFGREARPRYTTLE